MYNFQIKNYICEFYNHSIKLFTVKVITLEGWNNFGQFNDVLETQNS